MGQTNNQDRYTGSSLQEKVNNLIQQLEKIIEQQNILKPEPLENIIKDLREQVKDVVSIEENMNSVRREIIGPVKKDLDKTARLGIFSIWGFWVGIIGGILGIISLAFNIYMSYHQTTKIDQLQNRFVAKESFDNIEKPVGEANKNKEDIIPHGQTVKVGEEYKDVYTSVTLVVKEIFQDDTADVTLIRPWYGKQSFKKVKSGDSWEYYFSSIQPTTLSPGTYQLTLKEISHQTGSCYVEINRKK